MVRRNPTIGVLTFYSVTVTIATVVLLAGPVADRQRCLSASHEILEKLPRHIRVTAPGSAACTHLCFLLDAFGTVQGTACTVQWDHDNRAVAEAERHLAFSLDMVPRVWLPRDPGRPLQQGLRLLRQGVGSDLLETGAGRAVQVMVKTAGGKAVLSNRVDEPDMVVAGGELFTPAMLGSLRVPDTGSDPVPAILAKLLRARICDDLRRIPSRCYDTALTIISDREKGQYLLELQPAGVEFGMARAQLSLSSPGALHDGVLRVLADSDLDLQAELYLVPPKPPGELLSPQDPGFVAVGWGTKSPRRKLVQVDFRALLARTGWLAEEPPETEP